MTDTPGIDMLIDYILENKEWIFSGIGVLAISGVVWFCRHLLFSRLPTTDGKLEVHHAPNSNPVLTPPFVARAREDLSQRFYISPTQIEIARCEPQGLTHFRLFVIVRVKRGFFESLLLFKWARGYDFRERTFEVIADASGEVIAVTKYSRDAR